MSSIVKKWCANILTSTTVIAFAVCAVPAVAADKLSVVTSFSILGDIVHNVAGDRLAVTSLVGPNQDAHVFQVTPDQMRQVARAKLVVINGLGFEGWVERVVKMSSYKGQLLVASDGITVRDQEDEDDHDHDHSHGKDAHQHGKFDPHAWQDPRNVVTYTTNIVAALSKLDAAGAATYKKNGDAYIAQLKELDAWAVKEFNSVPKDKRKVITSHDAFNYLGARYQIAFLSPQGISTDSEPNAKDVAALIRQIKKEKIKAVFFENMSTSRVIEQISKEAGVTVGGRLYADALSKADGPAATYLHMMRYNISALIEKMRMN